MCFFFKNKKSMSVVLVIALSLTVSTTGKLTDSPLQIPWKASLVLSMLKISISIQHQEPHRDWFSQRRLSSAVTFYNNWNLSSVPWKFLSMSNNAQLDRWNMCNSNISFQGSFGKCFQAVATVSHTYECCARWCLCDNWRCCSIIDAVTGFTW